MDVVRITELQPKTYVEQGDYIAIDNQSDGTKKVQFTNLLDDTLSQENKIAPANVVGDEIATIRAAVGSPLKASTVAQMTDTNKIYVYVGSESGYTNGNWYYWNGSAWTSGGVYNSVAVVTDPTLTLSGVPADAKATGDEVTNLKDDFDKIVTEIIEPISLFNPFFVDDGHYIWSDGSLQDNTDFATSGFIAVEPSTTYVGNFTNHCLFFDSTKTAIQDSFTNTVTTVTSPANGYYVRFDWRKTTVSTDDIYFIPQSADIPFDYKFKISDIVTIPESQKGLPRVATANLFDLSTYTVGQYVSSADGSFPSNAEFARSDYMPVTPNANYVGNYTNHVCWYTKDKTFISGTNQVYSSTAPATARFAVIDFKTATISADNIMFVQANSLPTQYIPHEEPLYRIPSDMIIGAWESIWKGKNVLFYGDSITAQITGDSPTGWSQYIYNTFSLDSVHGKGVGGQTFVWNNNTFQADANGNYVNRGTASDNCLGCFPSWQRISTMIPSSICNSLDLVVIMGGTNDFDGVEEIEGGSNIDYVAPAWSSSNSTDSVWISSNEYNGGDYDVTTFCGAVASTIMKMQKRCPNAIIVLASPLSRSDLTTNAPTVKNGKTTQDLADTMCKLAKYMSVPFFDITTNCGVNAWNQATYYQDAVHPNTAGGKLLARTLISEMIGLYPRI